VKKSKAETAETRRRIVECAAREFRRNGIHATGLDEVMAAAGLTRGGFYRHFQSKDQLVAEACAAGMDTLIAKTESAARRGEGENGLDAFIDSYLAVSHRDDRAGGCPLAGLGSEMARADERTRAAVSAEFLKLVDLLAKQSRRRKPEQAKSDALFALSATVGAVTLSRIVTDPDVSRAILADTKRLLGRSPT
jgi:TetR/AcrR family transcriptional regulator, transcriptional repressor for nem operon